MKIFYVYILYSASFDKYYIGQNQNVDTRLNLHNSKMVKSTKPYVPWNLVLVIEKSNRSESILLEKKLKNLNRIRLLAFIEKYK